MSPYRPPTRSAHGFTLVELMITIAVLSIIVAIALPAYTRYVREGHYAVMQSTINSMRTPIEDTRLDNGTYGTVGDLTDFAAIDGRFNLDDDIDFGPYDYTVSVVTATNYHLWARYNDGIWLRCENRGNSCCTSNAANDPSAACN